MKAVVLANPGATPLSACLKLDPCRPVPKPGPGQALVKVASSAANPVDVYVASGRFGGADANKNKVMAGDLAGVVVELGAPAREGEAAPASPPSSSSVREGDRVWALTPYFWSVEGGHGCWAEFCVADVAWLAPAPPEGALPLADAGAGPLVLCTAWQALEAALGPPRPESDDGKEATGGKRPVVLVTAAAGGVGHVCVQMAKRAWGAKVVAVAGARNREFCLEQLGADEFVDYADEGALAAALGEGEGAAGGDKRLDAAVEMLGGGWTARLARASRKVSHILGRDTDRAALDSLNAAAAAKRGGGSGGESGESGGPAVSIISVTPDAAALGRAARMIARGELKIEVAARYPLERAGKALEQVAGWHTRGKVAITVE